jgi:hypothetical protein
LTKESIIIGEPEIIYRYVRLALFGTVLLLVACSSRASDSTTAPGVDITPAPATATTMNPKEARVTVTPEAIIASEHPVTPIPLAGPVAARNSEISGLTWYGEHLIILPQYPNRIATEENGAILALRRSDINAYLDGATDAPLEPIQIPFSAPGLTQEIKGFEGYEAIAFAGDRVFVTVEATTRNGMRGYLVSGRIEPDLSAITLDTSILTEIEPQSKVGNMSDETLIVAGETLVTVYEVNGTRINAQPVAHLFDLSLAPFGTVLLPNVEYRITDATALDGSNRFWVINFLFPGDRMLVAERDPLAEQYGKGRTHQQSNAVERLVEFQYSESGIELTDTPPIQLELVPIFARNWEGLARLEERGFLIMTDTFPQTILGFVPASD